MYGHCIVCINWAMLKIGADICTTILALFHCVILAFHQKGCRDYKSYQEIFKIVDHTSYVLKTS